MLAVVLSLALRLAAPSADASAEPPLVELQWQAPPECPDGAAVHAAIAGLVPERPLRADEPPRVDAVVEREPTGFRLRLRLVSKSGERTRELRARACASLVDAVAMEVALLVEAEREAAIAEPSERAAASTPIQPTTPTPVATRTTTVHTTSTRPAAPRRPHWRLRAGVLVGARVVEDAFAAPTLGAAVVGRAWAAAIDLAHWPRGFVAVPGRSAEGSRLSLSTLTVSGCGRWARGRFGLAGCGGVEIGVQSARGIGLVGGRTAAEPSLAFVLAPHVEVAVHRLVRLAIGPWVRLSAVRPGVRVDGVGELYRAAVASFGGVFRVEVEIPGRNRRGRGM